MTFFPKVGRLFGIMLFWHKTKHTRFMVLVPLWTVIWAAGMVLLVRYGQIVSLTRRRLRVKPAMTARG